MRKRIVLFVLLVVLLVFPVVVKAKQPATTQEPPTPEVLQNVRLLLAHVSIWPEYEDGTEKPGELNALVINRYVIEPKDVHFPATVRIQIPATAIELRVVAVGDSPETASDQGVVYSTSTVNKDWADLFVAARAPAIRVEYYDYNIARDGLAREYIYAWPGTYPVGTFRVDVRVPLQATNMRSVPDATLAGTDAEGFKFGEMSVPDMIAGKTFELKINYDRDTNQPSTVLMQSSPATLPVKPVDEPASEHVSPASYFPWVLAGLGVGLIAAIYWLSTRRGGSSSRRRK